MGPVIATDHAFACHTKKQIMTKAGLPLDPIVRSGADMSSPQYGMKEPPVIFSRRIMVRSEDLRAAGHA